MCYMTAAGKVPEQRNFALEEVEANPKKAKDMVRHYIAYKQNTMRRIKSDALFAGHHQFNEDVRSLVQLVEEGIEILRFAFPELREGGK